MIDRSNLRVLVFPADDVALIHEVRATMARVPQNLPETAQIRAVEQELRRWYRTLQIRPRETLAGYDDDPVRVWYVYRDGRIRARKAELERLYRAMATARETERESELAIETARRLVEKALHPRRAAAADLGAETMVTIEASSGS